MEISRNTKIALTVGGVILLGGLIWLFINRGGVPFLTPTPTPSPQEAEGKITEIAASARIITIESQGKTIEVAISNETKLFGKDGKQVDFSTLHVGFEVFAKGMGTAEAFLAEEVRITKEPNVIVFEPKAGARVDSPIKVRGEARVFESVVSLRVKDNTGKVIFTGFTMSTAPDIGIFGLFDTEIFLPPLSSPNITLEVFWASPRDGSDLDVVSIPLVVRDTAQTEVKVFFGNNSLNTLQDCTKVFPVTRKITRTAQVGKAALFELLKGPTSQEKQIGFFTSIPEGVTVNSLAIASGVAKADFSVTLEAGVGGSCRVAAIRSQIAETLKQFSTVTSVIISINGRTEDILQP